MMRACRVLAARLADRLARLAHGLAGDGAGVEDDRAAVELAEPGGLRLAAHHLGFVGVEPAAEGDDRRRAIRRRSSASSRAQAPVAGSKLPENSHSAGPVMTTWSSSRQSISERRRRAR